MRSRKRLGLVDPRPLGGASQPWALLHRELAGWVAARFGPRADPEDVVDLAMPRDSLGTLLKYWWVVTPE